jgi:hypothetical protein
MSRRAFIDNNKLYLFASSRGKWTPDIQATLSYIHGRTRLFQPFEDLIISSDIQTHVRIQWPLLQPEEITDISGMVEAWIPMGEVIGPDVSMEAIEEGSYEEYLTPQLSYDHYDRLTIIPVQTPIRTPAPTPAPVIDAYPAHIIRILLEKAAADGTTCPITGDLITPASGSVTPCGHLFEKTALKLWKARSATCPECRCKI